ncbi:MAG: hydroxyacid dehydrogenase [Clostridia bacterium]|nr:hydroxyacid dehydrogenase [Clostridia bacterium]
MKIVMLDSCTLGEGLDFSIFEPLGEFVRYEKTAYGEISSRVFDADVIITNKCKLNAETLAGAESVKLICLAATGYDNVDLNFCREKGIGVANVVGYSTDSVAQVTVGIALELLMHLRQYDAFVREGKYSESGVANRLIPTYFELSGKTWGIVGYGNIGRKVGEIAKAFGCNVIVNKREKIEGVECVSLDELFKRADIISVHTPLTDATRGLIGAELIEKMKKNSVLVNTARGAVTDEKAVADAVKSGKLFGFGTDVYSLEPFGEEHPFYEIKDFDNVFMTPHMAWGAFEARERCMAEIVENILAFSDGIMRNRVEK